MKHAEMETRTEGAPSGPPAPGSRHDKQQLLEAEE